MHNNDAFVQKQDSIESMSYPASTYATIDEWTAKESISFSVDSPKIFKDAVDKVMAYLTTRWSCLALEKRFTAARIFSGCAIGFSSDWWRLMATAQLPWRAVFPERIW